MPRLIKLIAVCCFGILTASSLAVAGDEWVELFDGETLDGWIQKNGTATYVVDDGTIVGTTNEGSPNSFLCTEELYGDFELEFEVRVSDELNSGVQIRSQTAEAPEGEFGRVNGPQVEIESSGENGAEAGYIYGEATRFKWLVTDEDRVPHKQFRDGEWNHFRVLAEGPRIRTWINGRRVGDLTHEEIYETHQEGFIGLQVHGVRPGNGPYQVAWKDIRIRVLDDEE